ncbi:hypothetical protein DL767_010718 [Monosporascus sp. MG133]|nr:hypothetical protein DL767_010718 [Monosporascus sp. MG133]
MLDECGMKEIKALKRERNGALREKARNHPESMRPLHDVVAYYGERSVTLLNQLRLNLQSVFDHIFDNLAVGVQRWDDVSKPLQAFLPSQDRSNSIQFGADLARLIHEYVTEKLKPLAQERDEALRVGARDHLEPYAFYLYRIAEYKR